MVFDITHLVIVFLLGLVTVFLFKPAAMLVLFGKVLRLWRKEYRIDIKKRIDLHLAKEEGMEVCTANLTNVSLSGFRIQLSETKAQDLLMHHSQSFNLSLSVDGSEETLVTQAQVVWHSKLPNGKYEIGCKCVQQGAMYPLVASKYLEFGSSRALGNFLQMLIITQRRRTAFGFLMLTLSWAAIHPSCGQKSDGEGALNAPVSDSGSGGGGKNNKENPGSSKVGIPMQLSLSDGMGLDDFERGSFQLVGCSDYDQDEQPETVEFSEPMYALKIKSDNLGCAVKIASIRFRGEDYIAKDIDYRAVAGAVIEFVSRHSNTSLYLYVRHQLRDPLKDKDQKVIYALSYDKPSVPEPNIYAVAEPTVQPEGEEQTLPEEQTVYNTNDEVIVEEDESQADAEEEVAEDTTPENEIEEPAIACNIQIAKYGLQQKSSTAVEVVLDEYTRSLTKRIDFYPCGYGATDCKSASKKKSFTLANRFSYTYNGAGPWEMHAVLTTSQGQTSCELKEVLIPGQESCKVSVVEAGSASQKLPSVVSVGFTASNLQTIDSYTFYPCGPKNIGGSCEPVVTKGPISAAYKHAYQFLSKGKKTVKVIGTRIGGSTFSCSAAVQVQK